MTTAAANDLAGVRLDPAVADLVRALNALPGATTRASCQGKSASDVGTHADLAYVLFEEPMPLSLEDHLVRELADLARIEPDGVYARWPERNRDLCVALGRAVETRRRAVVDERWKTARIARVRVEAHLARLLAGEGGGSALVWCASCAVVDGERHDGPGPRLVLGDGIATARSRSFAEFLDRDPDPIDPRLREREGDEGILDRLVAGAFGEAYRDAWRRDATERAALHRRREIRARVRELSTTERPTDTYVEGGFLVFAVRV